MLPEELLASAQQLRLRALAIRPATEIERKRLEFILSNCIRFTQLAQKTDTTQQIALTKLDYNGIIGTVSTLARSKKEEPSPELRTLLLDLAEIAANCRPEHD